MKTIAIIGTDIHGEESWWATHHPEENPWLDGGRLRFDRAHEPSMHNQYYELAVLAEVDGIAVGLRGIRDPGFEHLPLLASVIQDFRHDFSTRPAPTLLPWVDTVALGDIVNYDRPEHEPRVPFDFANDVHLELFWTHLLGPFFAIFNELGAETAPNPIHWERTIDRRPVIAFWGIRPDNGHGIVNQQHAQRLLDVITARMEDLAYGTPAFIVDETWMEYGPQDLQVYGVHGWFNPDLREANGKLRPPVARAGSIRNHNGVTVGVTVPAFSDAWNAPKPWRVVPRENGETLRQALAAMRAASADYVLIESYNNRVECAGLYRTDTWWTRELDTVREHIREVRQRPPQDEPEPVRQPPDHQFLDQPLTWDRTYDLFVHQRDELRALVASWYRESHEGREPSDGDIQHGILRVFEPQQFESRWGTMRRALENAWPFPVPPSAGLFPPEAGRLHIIGPSFHTEQNQLWQWRGFSWFLGFLRYCRGEDVTPDLRWLRANGFNIVRVFGPLPWEETPDYRIESFQFDTLDAFFSLLEKHGLRCNFSIGHYRHPGLAKFAQRFYDIASQHWCVVAERVNEPHVGVKPDPIRDFAGVDSRGVLTSYGLYGEFYDKKPGLPPVLDFGGIHITRDAAWHRKARHAQEIQHKTGKPWISDEPAKIIEANSKYPGGKNDPKRTPAEAVWHAAVCALWTAGSTVHTEEGKWGRVPTPGMLQHTVVEAVRDHVFLKIDANWQTGEYNHSENHDSPVDDVNEPDGDPIWTYTSLHASKALSVRCGLSRPRAKNEWQVVARWGPGESLVRLAR